MSPRAMDGRNPNRPPYRRIPKRVVPKRRRYAVTEVREMEETRKGVRTSGPLAIDWGKTKRREVVKKPV